jgi:hypothetical protein
VETERNPHGILDSQSFYKYKTRAEVDNTDEHTSLLKLCLIKIDTKEITIEF